MYVQQTRYTMGCNTACKPQEGKHFYPLMGRDWDGKELKGDWFDDSYFAEKACIACGQKPIPHAGMASPCRATNSGMHPHDKQDWARLSGANH